MTTSLITEKQKEDLKIENKVQQRERKREG